MREDGLLCVPEPLYSGCRVLRQIEFKDQPRGELGVAGKICVCVVVELECDLLFCLRGEARVVLVAEIGTGAECEGAAFLALGLMLFSV